VRDKERRLWKKKRRRLNLRRETSLTKKSSQGPAVKKKGRPVRESWETRKKKKWSEKKVAPRGEGDDACRPGGGKKRDITRTLKRPGHRPGDKKERRRVSKKKNVPYIKEGQAPKEGKKTQNGRSPTERGWETHARRKKRERESAAQGGK